jgi:hypothetical protein
MKITMREKLSVLKKRKKKNTNCFADSKNSIIFAAQKIKKMMSANIQRLIIIRPVHILLLLEKNGK